MQADDGAADPGWAAPWAVTVAAVISAALVIYATRRVRAPLLLQVLFAGWVVAPFGLLAAGLVRSSRWQAPPREMLSAASVIVAVASVIAYGVVALGSSRPRAAVFVLGPPVTSAVAIIAVLVAALRARRR